MKSLPYLGLQISLFFSSIALAGTVSDQLAEKQYQQCLKNMSSCYQQQLSRLNAEGEAYCQSASSVGSQSSPYTTGAITFSSGAYLQCQAKLKDDAPIGANEICSRKYQCTEPAPAVAVNDDVTDDTVPDAPKPPVGGPIVVPKPKPTTGGGAGGKGDLAVTPPKTEEKVPEEPGGGGGINNGKPAGTGDATADLAAADRNASAAVECCKNPASCSSLVNSSGQGGISQVGGLGSSMAGGGGQGGIQAACQQMQQLGGAGNNANSGYAGACYAKKSSCESLADSMISTYNSKGDQSAVTALYQIKQRCLNLQSLLTAMTSQSTSGAGAGGMGNMCSQLSAAQPQSADDAAIERNSAICANDSTSAACVDCSKNPTNAVCPQAAKDDGGQTGFAKKDDDQGEFNTPDIASIDPALGVPPGEAYESNPAIVVPNNTGGGIPGQGGQQAGAGGGKPGQPGSPGYDTDVMRGMMSGGYSAQAGNMMAESGGGAGGWGGYGRKPDSTGGYEGMDLKKYLPGGKNDPSRKVAGLGSANGEIGPKFGDIFKRISDRVQVLCRFNRLLDCGIKH